MNKTVENILECRKRVEREINRPLTETEQNIVRISFLFGRNTVYDEAIKEAHEKDKATKVVHEVWAELGNVIVDEDDNIEQGWKHFPPGANKLEIWHWIEETYDVSIAEDLMNSITE